ncbi:MAG: GNAT family N-acetyltransferase [Mycobacteriales bacterium]
MPWEFTDDVEVYADRVWSLLAARPAENTVPLTLIENVRTGQRWSADPMLFGWYGGAQVSGAVCWTPPYELLLAEVPDWSLAELVAGLRTRAIGVPGVAGAADLVDRFAAAWTAATSLPARTAERQRLYALAALRPPTPPPAGRPRPAGEGDVALAERWFLAFQQEAGDHPVDVAEVVRRRVEGGLLWLWEDGDGGPGAMAGRTTPVGGVARVGPVYTPPERRRHGFGTAVTAACTADALRVGAAEVVLFTDLANPTSNAIYQQIGYRPVSDRKIVRFGP